MFKLIGTTNLAATSESLLELPERKRERESSSDSTSELERRKRKIKHIAY